MIEIISDNEKLHKAFLDSMDRFNKYYWVTAWTGKDKEILDKLRKNKGKIGRIITGVESNRDNPITADEFIQEFGNDERVFILEQGGKIPTVHSKVYLFCDKELDLTTSKADIADDTAVFEIYIGSANLTIDGFHNNTEVMVKCNQEDTKIEFIKNMIFSVSPAGPTFKNNNYFLYNSIGSQRHENNF